MPTLTPRAILVMVAIACGSALAAALVAQHRFGMEPCPWCIVQRLQYAAITALALAGALVPWPTLRRLLSAAIVAVAGSGVAAALWQHFFAAKSNSCALTLADRIISGLGVDTRWPEVFEVRASCADAAVKVLGVPFEFWSLALFAMVGVLALLCAVNRHRRAG